MLPDFFLSAVVSASGFAGRGACVVMFPFLLDGGVIMCSTLNFYNFVWRVTDKNLPFPNFLCSCCDIVKRIKWI